VVYGGKVSRSTRSGGRSAPTSVYLGMGGAMATQVDPGWPWVGHPAGHCQLGGLDHPIRPRALLVIRGIYDKYMMMGMYMYMCTGYWY